MSSRHWPLFDLRIRTPRLELRHPSDDLMVLDNPPSLGVTRSLGCAPTRCLPLLGLAESDT